MRKTLSIHASEAGRATVASSVWRVPLIVLAYLLVFWGLLPAFLFIAGMRLDLLVPITAVSGFWTTPLGWGLVLIGSLITVTAMIELGMQGRGYPISHLPPTEFVVHGFYHWRRHPIYVGYTALFIGVGLLLESPWSVGFSGPLLLLSWIWYARFFEEPVLIRRFGDSYLEYRERTPILFPGWCEHFFRRSVKSLLTLVMPAANRLAARVVLIRIGDFIVVTYGLIVAAGTLAALIPLGGFLESAGIDSTVVGIMLAGISSSGMLTARLFWWLAHRRDDAQSALNNVRRVGFVSWGGLGGMMALLLLCATYAQVNLLLLTDALMRVLYIAYGIGRLGCLTYGCCYGTITDGPGVLYWNPDAKVIRERGHQEHPRHPTQVYSIGVGLFLAAMLNVFALLRPSPGAITALGLIVYGVARFFVEPFRERRRMAGGVLTEGHLGCIAGIAAGWILLAFIPVAGDAPSVSLPVAVTNGLRYLPEAFFSSFIVFVTMGSHWKKIGTW